jgi:hypothetical protein
LLKTKLCFLFLISFTFVGHLRAQAQSIQNDSHSTIDTKADLGFMAILGGDMEYSLNGQKIVRYQDFKSLIYSQHDPEASNLIRQAEATDLISWIVLATGISASIDIAIFYKPPVVFNSDIADRVTEAIVTAQIGFGAFAIIHNIAEGRKFNAIQRYNHLIRKQREESSIELSPKLYTCSNGLVLGGQLSF